MSCVSSPSESARGSTPEGPCSSKIDKIIEPVTTSMESHQISIEELDRIYAGFMQYGSYCSSEERNYPTPPSSTSLHRSSTPLHHSPRSPELSTPQLPSLSSNLTTSPGPMRRSDPSHRFSPGYQRKTLPYQVKTNTRFISDDSHTPYFFRKSYLN
jgi:hypothetical protein